MKKDEQTAYWLQSVAIPTYPTLTKNMETDVCVVGAGITGITTAYLLAKEGLSVVLVEANDVLHGTTGHTSAKVTAQHGLIYNKLLKSIGKNEARLYYEANKNAVKWMRKIVEEENINCEWRDETAYLYAMTEKGEKDIEDEYAAYEQLHIKGELTTDIPISLPIKNALKLSGQGQFHPVKYCLHLLKAFEKLGGKIFQQVTAVNITSGVRAVLQTKNEKEIGAKYIVCATHYPFYEGLGMYAMRMYAERSYVVAATLKEKYAGGMYINAEKPARSIRQTTIDGKQAILLIGDEHRTGEAEDTSAHYRHLHTFGMEHLHLEKEVAKWSAQDLTTLDEIPYVGSITPNEENILIATGFRKWGMTNGTAAAHLIKDIVLGKENRFRSLYQPSRFHATASVKNFLKQNVNVVGHLLKGKLEVLSSDIEHLELDQATVIREGMDRKGVYKDPSGKVHIVDTTCTHIGCEVAWNDAEKSWDCPCHGSRFTYTGEVLEGPAEKPLQTYDYKMIDNITSDDSGY